MSLGGFNGGDNMTKDEAMEFIREHDPELYDYVQNNAWSFTDLSLVLYAEMLSQDGKSGAGSHCRGER